MRGKLNHAWKQLRDERYEEQRTWRNLKETLKRRNKVETYNQMWSREKNIIFAEFRKKRKEKVEWIRKKYYAKEALADVYEGVKVGEQTLDERFEMEPECYGNTQIDSDEKEVLKLHPKHTVFDKVEQIDCEAEIEKSLVKVRWKRISEENDRQRRDNGMATVDAVKKNKFDIDTREFDFTVARATELPFNAQTNLPGQLDRDEETKLQAIKHELIHITKEYT